MNTIGKKQAIGLPKARCRNLQRNAKVKKAAEYRTN